MARKKHSRENGSLAGVAHSICIGTATALAIVVALTALFAFIMSLVNIPGVILTGIVMLLLILTGFVSGYLSSKSIRKNGLKVGLSCGLLISLLLLLLPIILYDSLGWPCLSKILVVTASSCIGGVLGVNSRRKYR